MRIFPLILPAGSGPFMNGALLFAQPRTTPLMIASSNDGVQFLGFTPQTGARWALASEWRA
jgi:hypothetical protein